MCLPSVNRAASFSQTASVFMAGVIRPKRPRKSRLSWLSFCLGVWIKVANSVIVGLVNPNEFGRVFSNIKLNFAQTCFGLLIVHASTGSTAQSIISIRASEHLSRTAEPRLLCRVPLSSALNRLCRNRMEQSQPIRRFQILVLVAFCFSTLRKLSLSGSSGSSGSRPHRSDQPCNDRRNRGASNADPESSKKLHIIRVQGFGSAEPIQQIAEVLPRSEILKIAIA